MSPDEPEVSDSSLIDADVTEGLSTEWAPVGGEGIARRVRTDELRQQWDETKSNLGITLTLL